MKEEIISPGAIKVSRSCDTVFRHFDLGDSAEGEEQLDQICRRILGSLAHDVTDRGGYGRVKENTSGLQSGEIHAHCLSRLKSSHNSPRIKLWACCPPIAIHVDRPAELLRGAGILPAIFQPSTFCKNAGGTPAPPKPAYHARKSQKLSC
jgi:hypothetical protein